MKVWVVVEVSPYFCECDTQCQCGSDYRTPVKVFSTLKKAEKFIKAQPKTWKGSDYYEVETKGMEVE